MQIPFGSYKDIALWYAHARDKVAGRPVNNWGRVVLDGDVFHFYAHKTYSKEPFATVKPDNTITFNYTGSQMRLVSNTLTSALHRVLPFYIERAAKCRYRVISIMECQTKYPNKRRRQVTSKYGYDVYPGLTFDMDSGVCLNPKMPVTMEVSPEARRVWLRKLRHFKRQIKVRARMGALEKTIADNRLRAHIEAPDWTSAAWLDVLQEAIDKEAYTEQLMRGIAMHTVRRTWSRGDISYAQIASAVDDICSTTSIDLRLRFGVLTEATND